MRRIAELVGWIDEEIDGCEKYAQAAIKAKEKGEMEESRAYCDMARQECDHAEKLHGIIVKMIAQRKSDGASVPSGMLEIWEWKHNEYIARMAEAKVMLSMC